MFTALNFSITTALGVSHKFFNIELLLSFISRHFLISLVVSSLTPWLFGNGLFNFQIFVNSPNVLCCCFLISFNCSWGMYFVWSQSVNLLRLQSTLKNVTRVFEKPILLSPNGLFHSFLLDLFGLCGSSLLFLCWLCLLSYPLLQVGY